VADCYGNPLKGYDVSFYKQDLSYDTTYDTDINGILTIKRGQYALYSTESDEANLDYGTQSMADMPHRPIAVNAKQIDVILCYPKEQVKENILRNLLYHYQSKKFVLNKNLLIGLDTYRNIIYRSNGQGIFTSRLVL
jgi:hypothetical protein